MSFKGSFDSSRIKRHIDQLGNRAKDAIRPAAQAGIQVYYNEVKLRVPVGSDVHYSGQTGSGRKFTYRPGNLRNSIYQVYSDESVDGKKAVYLVSYNKSKAFYGRFVENGTSKMAAQPFIRPSYYAQRANALDAIRTELRSRLKG